MLTEKVKSGNHHSSSLPSSPTSPSSSSASLLLPPPSAPSLDSFLIKSQANGISKSRSNSSSSSSSTTSSRAHRTDPTKSHSTPDPYHNDGAGHNGSKGDSSRHQTENTLAQLAVTCLRFNVEVLARARASGCVHAVSILSIYLSLLPFFLSSFIFIHYLFQYCIYFTCVSSSYHTSYITPTYLNRTVSLLLLSLSLSLSHTHTHTHRRAHTFFHKLTPTTPPPLSLTHSLTTLSCISPPLLLYSSSPPLLLLLFIQFFEHLEEMVIYDTGRVCARALIQELVIDMPVQPLPAPTPLGSPDGEGCYVMLCYDMLC